MMHPPTYINKLVFAGSSHMELWNIIDDKKIYEFKRSLVNGAQVTVITQSPVIHTVAIGFSTGDISIVNL